MLMSFLLGSATTQADSKAIKKPLPPTDSMGGTLRHSLSLLCIQNLAA